MLRLRVLEYVLLEDTAPILGRSSSTPGKKVNLFNLTALIMTFCFTATQQSCCVLTQQKLLFNHGHNILMLLRTTTQPGQLTFLMTDACVSEVM